MEKVHDRLKNRYPGGQPFSENDEQLFFGRQRDVIELGKLIEAKQTVVLFSKSGYGKSSLINAGIIPTLRGKNNVLYFSIKFNNFSQKEKGFTLFPLDKVIARLSEPVKLDVTSVFYNLVPGENSLWYWIKQNQLTRRETPNLRIVIFFEQFEELFTYPKEEVLRFSEYLSEMLNTTMPDRYRQIIDDFGHPGFDNDFYSFINQKPDLRVVFAIRADRLSQMNMLSSRNPSILQCCYELEALSLADAKSTITEPAKLPQTNVFKSPTFYYNDKALKKILDGIANVQDGKVEAATLQIICRHIEDNLINENHGLITAKDLGDITNIFQQYYESVLDKLSPPVRGKAENLIENELIDGERRNALGGDYIKSKFKITQKLLNALEQSSLLKRERDISGRFMYEIGHDTIAAAVNRVAQKKKLLKIEQERQDREQLVLQQEVDKNLKLEQEAKDRESQLMAGQLHAKELKRRVKVREITIWVIGIFTLIFGGVLFALLNSVTNETKLKASQARFADSLKNERRLKAITNALELMYYGDSYANVNGANASQNAINSYQSALDTMKNFPNDTLFKKLQRKINDLNEEAHK